MIGLVVPPVWHHRSEGPDDERFADVVESGALSTAGGYDAVLVGQPLGREDGTPSGPTAFREALARTKTRQDGGEFDGTVADLGDVGVPPDETDPNALHRLVREFTERIHATDAVPVFFGGDRSLTYPNAAPLLDRGSLGIVAVGAWDRPVSRAAGRPYRRLTEAGLDALAVLNTGGDVGADSRRGPDRTAERAVAAGTSPDETVAGVRRSLGAVDSVFVSLDLAGVDAVVDAPDRSRTQLFAVLEEIAADDRIAGIEVVGDGRRGRGDGSRERGDGPSGRGDEWTTRAGPGAVAHFLLGLEGDP